MADSDKSGDRPATAEIDTSGMAPARRPRRPDVATYQVRAELKGTRPPLWRRLELSSDLLLSEIHAVIQYAFGWEDSHLHQFASSPNVYSLEAERYLCPSLVAEGEVGVPEEQVRLDEVLAEPGDKLYYVYDFGDDWEHVIKLEAVRARDASSVGKARSPRAVCVGGRRDGPPEDCGGVYGFELLAAVADPAHHWHAEAVAQFARDFGDEADPGEFPLSHFDPDAINADLAAAFSADPAHGQDLAVSAGGPPGPLGELVTAVQTAAGHRALWRLVDAARLDEPVVVTAATAARMVYPHAWLLDRVGAEGIKLTGAGHLPPADVQAAMTELQLDEGWIGKANREALTPPVLHLRESAMKLGLLHKYSGSLMLTPRGRSLRGDPVGLWWQLAERMPFGPADSIETQAGLLLLAVIAAGVPDDPNPIVARLLGAIGWVCADDTRLTSTEAGIAVYNTATVLRQMGAFSSSGHGFERGRPTPDGITFTRATLQTWPA